MIESAVARWWKFIYWGWSPAAFITASRRLIITLTSSPSPSPMGTTGSCTSEEPSDFKCSLSLILQTIIQIFRSDKYKKTLTGETFVASWMCWPHLFRVSCSEEGSLKGVLLGCGLKWNQEHEALRCKVGHCLQKSLSCGSAVGGHYFDYCQGPVLAVTESYIITLTMESLTSAASSLSVSSSYTRLQVQSRGWTTVVCKCGDDQMVSSLISVYFPSKTLG